MMRMMMREEMAGMGGGMPGGGADAMMQEMRPMMRMMMREEMAGMGRGMMGAAPGAPAAAGVMPAMGPRHVEGRIAFLKAELAITDAQLPQWNAFAAVLRDTAKTMAALHAAMAASAAGPAPERIDAMVGHMAARLDAMKAMSAALRPLYGVLSAGQRKSADELLASGMGRM